MGNHTRVLNAVSYHTRCSLAPNQAVCATSINAMRTY